MKKRQDCRFHGFRFGWVGYFVEATIVSLWMRGMEKRQDCRFHGCGFYERCISFVQFASYAIH